MCSEPKKNTKRNFAVPESKDRMKIHFPVFSMLLKINLNFNIIDCRLQMWDTYSLTNINIQHIIMHWLKMVSAKISRFRANSISSFRIMPQISNKNEWVAKRFLMKCYWRETRIFEKVLIFKVCTNCPSPLVVMCSPQHIEIGYERINVFP